MDTEMRRRLLVVTALASRYCLTVENAAETERDEFILSMLNVLPRLYIEFNDIVPAETPMRGEGEDEDDFGFGDDEALDEYSTVSLEPDGGFGYYGQYVDEDYYESVRRHVEMLLGPDDVFLETFEEDMKYSDTPIAASIAECLADIFRPLYNFISIVKDTDGAELEGAYRECRENFVEYWSQTLCNVLRALNHVYYSNK